MRSFDTWWIFGAIVQTASHVSGFDRVAEPRAKADRAQNAELVFFEPRVGIADGANYLGGNVLLASNVVDDFLRCGIVQQPVNREIPPQHILAGVCEDHPGGPAAIHIRFVGSKCRNFVRVAMTDNKHNAELRADGLRPRKDLCDLFGPGAGRDVVVDRLDSHDHVAHASADEISLVTAFAQFADDRQCGIRFHSRYDSWSSSDLTIDQSVNGH